MAKKVDHAKAKAARQKKIAIGLGVVLLAVMAYQGPKTLKMLKGPARVAAPAATTPTAAPAPEAAVPPLGAPAPAVAPTAGAPGSPQPAVLASSDLPPTAGAGQLLTFELFKNKDPFVQQANAEAPVSSEPARDATPSADPGAPTGEPEDGATSGTPGGSAVPADTGAGSPTPFATGPTLASATTISVNGNSEAVAEGKTFPLKDPVFVFVSAALDGKSVQIGIAGGEYADGKDTIALKLGKPLTLQNTADGSRYELKLQTVTGFPVPGSNK